MKRMTTEVAIERLSLALAVFDDAGLTVSAVLSDSVRRTVLVALEGAAIPDDCSSGDVGLVAVTLAQETYGCQRLTRIAEFKPISDRAALRARLAMIFANMIPSIIA